ncbi:carbohydrate ABC transporter permease [Mycoplasma todarodis]|uniref:ABC transmembrane type-1 domain-containing protein n=1 Tax=Mycoplasma todarodis TaxID=1937191 RepID=A0A4R0XV11_9MOLU|nr:sugar ABC transporter permease [Mycoplasma todarodis]TCG11657.1 hypothetical protein C4B25_00920 [Mycoplasma todarodis]
MDKKELISGEKESFEPLINSNYFKHFKMIAKMKREAKKDFKSNIDKKEWTNIQIKQLIFWEKQAFIYEKIKEIDYDALSKFEIANVKLDYLKKKFKMQKEDWINFSKSAKDIRVKAVETNDSKAQQEINAINSKKIKDLENIKSLRDNKKVSRAAYKAEKKRIKMFAKSDVRQIKMLEEKYNKRENFIFDSYRLIKGRQNLNKKHRAELQYINKKNPFESKIKGRRWFAVGMNALLPGLGTILNKQYIKGIIQTIFSSIFLAFVLIFALGKFGEVSDMQIHGQGLRGLFTLGSEPIIDDSRYFLIEGIVTTVFLALYAIYLYISVRNAYIVGKAMEKGSRPNTWKETRKYLSEDGFSYVVTFPLYLIITFATILPLVVSIVIIFTNYGEVGHVPPGDLITWSGIDNLRRIFDFSGQEGKRFLNVLSWSFIWGLGATLTSTVAGIGLALMVNNKRIKGKKLIRLIYILPTAIPGLITILYFKIIFANNGMFNQEISPILFPWVDKLENAATHAQFSDIKWKTDVSTLKSLLFVINIWLGFTGMFLLVTGLLQSISQELYEAADVDGANSFTKFSKITAPLLMYQIAPLLIGAFVGGFNNFGLIYLFNEGGPVNSQDLAGPGETDILLSYVFKLVRDKQQPALGAAYVLLISLILGGIGLAGFLRTKTFKEAF